MQKCRACAEPMSSNSICYNLFPQESSDSDYTHWTEDFLEHLNFWQIEIRYDDGLPKEICEACFQSFSMILNFREQCCSADIAMREIKHEVEQVEVKPEDYIIEEVNVENTASDTTNDVEYVFVDMEVLSVHSDFSNNSAYDKDIPNKHATDSEDGMDDIIDDELDDEIDGIDAEKLDDWEMEDATTSKAVKTYSRNYNKKPILPPNPLLCTYCFSDKANDLLYSTMEEIEKHHEEIHSNYQKPYICLICEERFKYVEDGRDHFSVQHKPGETCHICGKFMKHISANHLQRHVKTTFTCEVCGIVMRNCSIIQFEYHKRWHDPKKQFKCSQEGCDKTFVTLNHLKAHMTVHKATGAYLCNVCGKDFATKFMLKIHSIRLHGGKPEIKCNICDSVFETYKQKRKHQDQEHPDMINIKCEKCHNYFPSETGMRLHSRRCKEEYKDGNDTVIKRYKVGGPITCDHCPQVFHTESTLLAHQKVHSSEGRPFPCHQCKKYFKTASNLRTHEQLKHSEKKFQCNVCQKKFAHGYTLTVHMESHNEEKFECDQCGNKFKMKKSLKLHKQIKHNTESNIKCDYCNEKFKYRQKLYTHLKRDHKFLYGKKLVEKLN